MGTSSKLLGILFFILFASPIFAFFEKLPDPENTEFTLFTVDKGPGLERRFGHTILGVRDTQSGEHYLLNWGTFDWDAPYYAFNFLKGFLRYWVSESSYESTLRYYRDIEKRTVTIDQIILSNEQKTHLLKVLQIKLNPDSMYFWYDFFYNNCATIPRDILNEVLYDQIAKNMHAQPATMKLRSYVQRDLSEWAFVAFFLDIMLNSTVDKDIDAWVEMFLPQMLRNYLAELPQFADDGTAIPGTKLLSGTRQWAAGEDYPSSKFNMFLCVLVFSLSLLLLVFFLRFRCSVWSKRLLGMLTILWGLFAGFLGFVLAAGWVLTNHTVLCHNVNLWVFWPIDVLWIGLGFALLCGKQVSRRWRSFILVHALALLVFFILYFAGFWLQDVSNIVYYLAPIAGLLYALLLI